MFLYYKYIFIDFSKKPVDLFDPMTYGESYAPFAKKIEEIEKK